MKEEIDHCFATGMDAYLPKPLEMTKLREMLQKWLPDVASSPAAEAPKEAPVEVSEEQPKASDSAGDGPIDSSALKGVFGDDEETFKEILKDFVDPAASNVGEIEASFADRSADGVAAAAHKLKSSARSVGANNLADLCQTLETAGKAEDWDEIDKAVPHLPNAIQRVVEFIDNL